MALIVVLDLEFESALNTRYDVKHGTNGRTAWLSNKYRPVCRVHFRIIHDQVHVSRWAQWSMRLLRRLVRPIGWLGVTLS